MIVATKVTISGVSGSGMESPITNNRATQNYDAESNEMREMTNDNVVSSRSAEKQWMRRHATEKWKAYMEVLVFYDSTW